MPVFERDLPPLDTKDVAGSLKKIEQHVRYMQERIDYSMSQFDKRIRKLEGK